MTEKSVNITVDKIESLLKSCEKQQVIQLEFQEMIQPLLDHVRKQIRWKIFSICLQLLLILLLLFLVLVYTPLYYHVRALSRIGMIQLTPYWDWTPLYYRTCLVDNGQQSADQLTDSNSCVACEDIGEIHSLNNVTSKTIYENYLLQDLPFIVTDALKDWSIFRDDRFWFGNITEAYEKEYNLSRRDPCHFTTNIRLKHHDLLDFFHEIYRNEDRPWFAHWENCDKVSTKIVRQFYQRPYFISPAIDISYNNWIVVSSQYKANTYREVPLWTEMAMMPQIRGFNYIRLTAKKPCQTLCPTLEFILVEGDILVITSKRWNLEYQPGEEFDNLAFIIQGEIN